MGFGCMLNGSTGLYRKRIWYANGEMILGEHMVFENFLTETYLGSFDPSAFHAFKDIDATQKSEEMVKNYLEISKAYGALELEKQQKLPKTLLEQLGKIHFFGLNIPELYGGVGLSLTEYLKVVESLAPHNLSLGFTALAHLSIGVKGIVLFGNESQKRKYLPKAASGEMIFAYALTEPNTGSDARHIETTAYLSDKQTHYILNGRKTYITNANYAGAMTVFAQMDPQKPGFMGAFVVETAWDGVTIGKEMPKMGLKASSTAMVAFNNVKIPVENLLGQPGDGFKIAMTILNYGRLALGAASSGMMKQSLRDMIKRSADRKQFGLPINRYELIQEKQVAAKVYQYVTSAITAFTAGQLNADPLAPVAVESSHCKLFGTTRAWDTLYDALQVAGGSGYLSTLPYEQRMRDFRVTTIFEGTTEIHSIYPALFMIRKLNERLKTQSGNKWSNFFSLIKMLFPKAGFHLQLDHREMKQSAKAARSISKTIRYLVVVGLLVYGRKIVHRQFLLRRISSLSFYFYGLLSVLAKIESCRKAGRSVGEDVRILQTFTEEAIRYKRQNCRLRPYRKDLLHKRLFREMTD